MSQMNPRPEAQPQTYDSLSKTQQRAVSGILQYLDQFVAKAPFPTAESETMVRLDLIRPSNVVLIDGERGSGKTETLLTLLGFWAAAFEPNDKDLQTIRSSVDAAVTREALPAIGVPVPVLDMQPLPSGISLLMQLATRLYRLVEHQVAPDNAKTKTKTPPFVDSADTGQALYAAWQRLVRAAASADSEGKASRNLAPEDLADALEWRERESGSLREAWREFASQVVKQDFRKLGYQGTPDGKPCLIVSIDDADMNPSRCVELLELVRSLWHPRVVFLLTGHTELFHELLQHKFEKDGLSSERAERLARLYFDKVVPKHQRFTVWADAASVLKLLSSSARELGSVMQLVPELKQSIPRRWRAVRDLESQMHGAPGPTSARVLFHSALEEADLAPAVVRHMERHVLPVSEENEDEGTDKTRLVLDDGDLVLQPGLNKQTVSLRDALSLTLYWRWQSQLAVKTGRIVTAGRVNEAPIPLPREVEAALYLAAISADGIDEGGRLNRELTPASYAFAESHIKTGKLDLCFAWPTPEWVKTVDFLLFRHRWEQLLGEFRPLLASAEADRLSSVQETALARLVYAFLSLLCTLGEEGEKSTFSAKDAAMEAPAWDKLVERLFKIAKDTSDFRKRVFADWAMTGATMFLWSEYGLPSAAQEEFARCWLRELWKSTSGDHEYRTQFDRVKQARKDNLRRTADSFLSAPVNDVQWLFDAVLATRHSSLGDLFREESEHRIAQWKERLVSRPKEQSQIAQEAIDDVLSNIQRRRDSDLSAIFDHDTFNEEQHLAIHLRDLVSHISVTLPSEGSTILGGYGFLSQYLNMSESVEKWPKQEILLISGPKIEAFRELISSLQGYADKDDGHQSIDALRKIVDVFAKPVSTSLPDLSKEAMLARTYQLPFIDAQDSSFVIQPGLHPDWQLQVTRIDRDTWWLEGWSNAGIELARMLTSWHDLIVDHADIELERTDIAASFKDDLCFTEQLSVNLASFDCRFMSAEPKWLSITELKLAVDDYGLIAAQIRKIHEKRQDTTALNVYCLSLILCVNRALFGLRNSNSYLVGPVFNFQAWGTRKVGEDRFAIRTARDYLARVRSLHYRGRRWQAVEAWARYGVPLYAAPESGMTEEEASEWLSLFADAIEQDREQLRAVRRYRAQLALQKADKPATSDAVEALLEQIDASVPPTHAWLRLIEQRPIPPANPTGGTSPAPSTGTPPDTSSAAKPVQT